MDTARIYAKDVLESELDAAISQLPSEDQEPLRNYLQPRLLSRAGRMCTGQELAETIIWAYAAVPNRFRKLGPNNVNKLLRELLPALVESGPVLSEALKKLGGEG